MYPQNSFVFSKSDVNEALQSQLYGYALTDTAVIFGTKGLQSYLLKSGSINIREGRFAGVFVDTDNVIIRADNTGQELIYYYTNGDDWSVSNSFYYLVAEVKKRHSLNLYEPSVEAFHLKRGTHIGEQLISHNTCVEEIKVLPVNAHLRICRKSKQLHIHTISYEEHFELNDPSAKYEEILSNAISKGVGILSAIKKHFANLNLFLSGGYDSRLVLGLLTADGKPNDSLNVMSHIHKKEDFVVAERLTKRLGLKLNQPTKIDREFGISSSESLRMYLASCGSTYLPMYPVSAYRQFKRFNVRLTGDQPTGWSHFAGNAKFNGTAHKIRADIIDEMKTRVHGAAVADDFMSTFDVLDVDPKSPFAMLAHYSAIRARFHCGRNWYKSQGSDFLFTPLMQTEFIQLDFLNANNGFEPKKVFADFFSAFGNWALEEPFETPDRAFSTELIKLAQKMRISPDFSKEYVVYGMPYIEDFESDFLGVNLNISNDHEEIKDILETLYYRANRAKGLKLFQEDDLRLCKSEINKRGSLSHNYRKTTHLISTEILMSLIQ
ncbi:hypothetical protein [Alteromonas sp. P256]|uniref:hypothetical protein n=1 Tax=Alteromonas sp. P256 TaxID=3117399 RepID=UPI002FE0B8B9